MSNDVNIVIEKGQYPSDGEFDEIIKKYITIAAIGAVLATPPKIQAANYSPNQIELKKNEIDKYFDIERYIDISKSSYEIENLGIICAKLDSEFKKYSHYIEKDVSKARAEAEMVAREISSIKFDKVSVELTPSNTVKFTLKFDERKMLMLTYPFDKIEGVIEGEVLFSFFIDRTMILSDSLNLKDLVLGINNYMMV